MSLWLQLALSLGKDLLSRKTCWSLGLRENVRVHVYAVQCAVSVEALIPMFMNINIVGWMFVVQICI